MSKKQMNKEQVVEQLLSDTKEAKTFIIICEDSGKKRSVGMEIEEQLRADPKFSVDRNVKFRVTNNQITFNDKKVILGVEKDTKYLSDNTIGEVIDYATD